MKAWPSTLESNPNQASLNDLSKRVQDPIKRGHDNVYARQRRLEQRIERIEATISTIRRDVYRIEKKQQREVVAPSTSPSPELPPGLFT